MYDGESKKKDFVKALELFSLRLIWLFNGAVLITPMEL